MRSADRPWTARGAGLLVAAVTVALLLQPFGSDGATWVSNLGYVAGAGIGAVCCAVGARRHRGRLRLAWHLLAAGEALWAAGNVWWLWYESVLRAPIPVPSAFDVAYVGGSLLVVAGVGVLVRPALRPVNPVRLLLDGLLVASSLFYVLWSAVLADLPGFDGSAERAVTWVYPIVDLTVGCVALLALSRVPREGRRCWLLLAGAMLLLATSDSVWAYQSLDASFASGSLIDPFWIAGYLLVGLAALTSDRAATTVTTSPGSDRWSALVPHAPFALVIATASTTPFLHHFDAVGTIAASVAVTALFLRQLLAVVENQRMARELERRVTERTAQLAESEALFRAVGNTISDAVVVLDADMRLRTATAGLRRVAGYDPEQLIGRGVVHLVHREDVQHVVEVARQVAARPGSTRVISCRVRDADGDFGHAEVTMANLLDHPDIRGYLLAIRDVSEQHELEERLRHRAERDELTGLSNRFGVTERLRERLAAGASPSVLLLDLDGFKGVNDSLGHAVGDGLLRAVAVRLRTEVRPTDLIGRLGGDEFVLVLDSTTCEAANVAARVVDSLDDQFDLDGRAVRCRASVGVASIGDTADDLLRNADLAMYAAKSQGRNRYVVFHAGLHERLVRRLRLEEALRGAIAGDELRLVFQPIVELERGDVHGAEALLRWELDGVDVNPLEFVTIAEESGLICDIGRWVLREACTTAASWTALRPDGPLPTIAVNVSVRQLVDADLVTDVRSALATSGLDPTCLTLELTESAVMEHTDAMASKLAALRELGVRISIDDFGTGYSSLGRLQHLPVDEIKIDRSFVGVIRHEDDGAPVVESILALARTLRLEVVAEGIETAAQAAALVRAGCRTGQGYLFGRPMEAAELAARLAAPPVRGHVGPEVANEALNFPV